MGRGGCLSNRETSVLPSLLSRWNLHLHPLQTPSKRATRKESEIM